MEALLARVGSGTAERDALCPSRPPRSRRPALKRRRRTTTPVEPIQRQEITIPSLEEPPIRRRPLATETLRCCMDVHRLGRKRIATKSNSRTWRRREEDITRLDHVHDMHLDPEFPWDTPPRIAEMPEISIHELRYADMLKWLRVHGRGEALAHDLIWIRTLRQVFKQQNTTSVATLQHCLASIGLNKSLDDITSMIDRYDIGDASSGGDHVVFFFHDFVDLVLAFENTDPANSIVLSVSARSARPVISSATASFSSSSGGGGGGGPLDDPQSLRDDADKAAIFGRLKPGTEIEALSFPSLAVGRYTRQRQMRDIAKRIDI